MIGPFDGSRIKSGMTGGGDACPRAHRPDEKCAFVPPTKIVIPDLIRDPSTRQDRALQYYVYMLAARKNGTLYVGVTNDLVRRAYQHRSGAAGGFTHRHDVKILVYFEVHQDVVAAIAREKKLKRWRRAWKIALIERDNPDWRDLYQDIV